MILAITGPMRVAIGTLMPGHPDFEKLIDFFDRALTAVAEA